MEDIKRIRSKRDIAGEFAAGMGILQFMILLPGYLYGWVFFRVWYDALYMYLHGYYLSIAAQTVNLAAILQFIYNDRKYVKSYNSRNDIQITYSIKAYLAAFAVLVLAVLMFIPAAFSCLI
ncbi:MAG: hypothetical protein IKS17_08305 [Firmicutes bacterium]|nr:hypothetical protein [Bacillota bacterium]